MCSDRIEINEPSSNMNFVKCIFAKLFYFSMGFVAYLVCLLAFVVSLIHRSIVKLILLQHYKIEYRPLKRGTTTMVACQTKTPVKPTYVLKCKGITNKAAVIKKVHDIVEYKIKAVNADGRKVPDKPYEQLRYVLTEKFGVFCWKLDHPFQPVDHVVFDNVKNDLDVAIRERSEHLMDSYFPNNKPQWEMHCLSRAESNEYALIWSGHHSYCDGVTFSQLIRYAIADYPFRMKEIPPQQWLRANSLFRRFLSFFELVFLCTLVSPYFATIFARCLGQTVIKENDLIEKHSRSHCRIVQLDFRALKTIRRMLNPESPVRLVSLESAFIAAAIDRALSSSNLKRPDTVLASVTESNYPYQPIELDNNVSSIYLDLPLKVDTDQERVFVIDKRIRNVTQLERKFLKIFVSLVGTFTAPVAKVLQTFSSATQTTFISNVPGPEEPFTIFNGDLVTDIYPYPLIFAEEAVTFAAYTYCDTMTITMVGSDRVVRKLPNFMNDIVLAIKDEEQRYKNKICK